jgi:RNase H-fold protein (predicted Holliday junction resolvase)
VIGRPAKQKDIQEKISKFMQWLSYTIESNKVNIDTIEEDYTSIESGEILSNFKKNVGEDTVSAMKILERRFDKQKNLDIKV